MNTRGNWTAILAVMIIWTAPALASDATSCEAAKLKIAGKYHYCRLKAEAKAVKTGNPVNYTRCDTKLGLKWGAAESSAGGMCPTNADQASVQGQVTTDTDWIALKLTGVHWIDNGDGTVTDTDTGLVWEQKDDLGGIHDKDNFYSWSSTGSAPDGTAFTTLLATLNNSVSGDGYTVTGCFTNHCDWRLPTVAELETILLEPFPCGTSPCIDPIFGVPLASTFWSGTTNSSAPTGAWYIFFGDGTPVLGTKTTTMNVRAVRGGQ